MPIGKNSLKRVTNNGYSAVKTAAPDMENSTVVTEPTPVAETKLATPKAEKKPATKTTAKKAATAKADTKPAAKTAPKADKPAEKKPATKTTAKKPTTATKKPATKATTAKKATATKATTAKKPENKIPRAPETASRIIARAEGEKGYCNLGDELPVHLL